MKGIRFLGTSRADLRAFPKEARQVAGTQLQRVQFGALPVDWKPLPSVGRGVIEIRVRVPAGAFRVMYVASIGPEVVVLHCFQKKAQRTSKGDVAVAARRYRSFLSGGV
jgi:phage-related protein